MNIYTYIYTCELLDNKNKVPGKYLLEGCILGSMFHAGNVIRQTCQINVQLLRNNVRSYLILSMIVRATGIYINKKIYTQMLLH